MERGGDRRGRKREGTYCLYACAERRMNEVSRHLLKRKGKWIADLICTE